MPNSATPAKPAAANAVRSNDAPGPRLNAKTLGSLRDYVEAIEATAEDKEDRQIASAINLLLDQHTAAPDMYGALTPFADLDGEGDEDLPDDTPVTIKFGRTTIAVAFTLGDLRRARAAIAKAKAGA